MTEKEIPPVWATAYDRFGDPSDTFTASREGLLYLGKKMEEALAKGEVMIGTEARFDFEKIVVSDTHPSRTLKPRPVLDKVMGAFVIIFILAVIVLAVYGGHALYVDWTHIAK